MMDHPNYEVLAARIFASNLQKNCPKTLVEALAMNPTIDPEVLEFARVNSKKLHMKKERDFLFSYFGLKTMQKIYLNQGETPQYLFMRVAIGIHLGDLKEVQTTYDLLSQKFFTHATPTMINAGTKMPQMSSCFLTQIKSDSVTGIYETLGDCAQISKHGGGIGIHAQSVRSKGTIIRGTNGHSDGIIPMCRVFNATARYVNQCFTGDTLVYANGTPKQIDQVKSGDNVITIDGTTKKVNEVIRTYVNKEILVIRPTHSMEPVSVTKEHEIYAITGQALMLNYDTIRNRLLKKIISPEFVSADSLRSGDFVGFPIPTGSVDFPEDLDYFRFYGIMLGDGHGCKNRNEFGVSLGTVAKVDTIEFVKKFLSSRDINFWVSTYNPSTTNIRWSGNVDKLNITRELLYDSTNEKRIPEIFMNLPIEKTMSLIKGLLETDGSIVNEITFTSTSKNLAYSMRHLMLRIGVLTSGYRKKQIGKSHVVRGNETITCKKDAWVVRIPKHPKLRHILGDAVDYSSTIKSFEYNGIIWSRIKTINTKNFDGYVYDLNIEENHNYLTDMGLVHNSGKRKGSFAVYLEPWHPDILEFLELRLNQGDEEARCRDLFTAMWIPDLFMKCVESNGTWALFDPDECPGLNTSHGEEFENLYNKYLTEGRQKKLLPAFTIWNAIIKSQIETGTPYMLYKDTCNFRSNQKNLGTLQGSNLCVAPETPILTKNGYVPICTLRDENVEVWNGSEWSSVIIKQTSESSELIRVQVDTGTFLECTPEHKFYVKNEYFKKPVEVRAKDLVLGDKLIKFECEPIEFGGDDFKYPYTHGFFCGDGTYSNNHVPHLSLYGEKMKLLECLEIKSTSGKVDKSGRINTVLHSDIPDKFTVPSRCSIKTRLEWLSGYMDADGTYLKSGGVQISCIHLDFLRKIQLMLHTLGVQSKITLMSDERQTMMPDGKGGSRLFDCKKIWRICISQTYVENLVSLGLDTKRIDTKNAIRGNRKANWFPKVESVVWSGRISPTFCFTEPKKHMGVFNGLLTGQCCEILEHTAKDEIAVCNLASISLPAFVSEGVINYESLHEVTKTITRNLNKIIDRNYYPVKEGRASNERHRPIGIGVQGLADVFMMIGLAFDSNEARDINRNIFETIYHGALEQSMELARKDGPYSSFREGPLGPSPASEGLLQFDLAGWNPGTSRYDWADMKTKVRQTGLRNSLLLAPMPTATTSQVLGNNECFEPYTTNIYLRRTLAGEFTVVNNHLVRDLQKLGMWTPQMKNTIIEHGGSVQNIKEIPEDLKAIYKTVWEISQKVIIEQARDRGAFICQSQSMNLFVEDPSLAKLSSMHMYAWKQGLKTGMYYLRTRPKVKPIQVTIEPQAPSQCRWEPGCVSCGS
jgi:ribonucleoside-diphosphate reductase alpha chain